MLTEPIVKIGGWRAPIFFGGAADVDRWRWLAAHAEKGAIRTLDAGSGLGALSFHAAHLGNEVVAISFESVDNQKARRRAKVLGFDNITFIDGDLRELDKMSGSLGVFDQVFCVEVIEHIENDAKLVHDLSALLKPGGKLLLSTPYNLHRPVIDEWINEHVRYGYSAGELRDLFKANNLEVISEEFITGIVSQKVDNLLSRIRRLTPHNRTLGWVCTFPLRLFQVFDGPVTKLTRWPHLSIAMVAVKRQPIA